jgi:uncharacterized protein YcbK (DUF882 family)
MKLTKNFNLSEFECKSGESMPNEVLENIITLATSLQALRDEVKASITITSGYRSVNHNKKIGGAIGSQHIKGTAADIKVAGYTPKQVAEIIESLIDVGKMKEGGLGIYATWIHYDVRGTKARWTK